MFGRGLEDHLRATGRDVAFVLEECITFLMPHLDEEVHIILSLVQFLTCLRCFQTELHEDFVM